MTSTFAARPTGTTLPCRYVIKVPTDDCDAPGLATCLLSREAIVGRKVCHPHLITVLDANVHQPPYYLVTPLLPGHTLREYLDSRLDLELNFILWVVRQTAEGLAALHCQHWLHGDVKPENILIAPDGHVTLLDLGFARQLNEENIITDQVVMGTCNYLAPEVATPTMDVGPGSDLARRAGVRAEGRPGQR
ncbi:MAG: protein kinase, partial [Planctomycetales bacterium]